MSISPLPQFEEDLASYLKEREDREAYERLNAPSTIVVRFGYSMMVGEFPYSGSAKPGCGSKLVVRTQRGTELGEMLTSTCRNSGCSKSVSRKEMLGYIENSGGRKYPFFEQGKVLRVAQREDLDEQARLEQSKNGMRSAVRGLIKSHGLEMRLVEVEPIFGGERVMVYFSAEDRVDFRELVKELQTIFESRVELVQVGARDEARIVADYERCGQYCCCKNFLKVLKPISMKSAKIQKATLDPLKISGRCGRLMCCLRYEDETYEALRKNLPHRKSRVGTPEGDGMVLDSQILTQLSKIRLDDGSIVAVAIEDLTEPVLAKAPEPGERMVRREARRGAGEGDRKNRADRSGGTRDGGTRDGAGGGGRQKRRRRPVEGGGIKDGVASVEDPGVGGDSAKDRPKRRRRRQGSKRPRPSAEERARRAAETERAKDFSGGAGSVDGAGDGVGEGSKKKKKKRRRRRKRRGGDAGGGDAGGGDAGGGGDVVGDGAD